MTPSPQTSGDELVKTLNVRGLVISPPLFLAPMAGLSHTALRRLALGFGGVGALSTEMLSARSLHAEDPRKSPLLARHPEERPLFYQLLASDPEEVARGVEAAHRLGADGVDLNFGCPAPQIRRRGGGSRLMERPDTAAAILARARAETDLPLSAKFRLGESLEEAPLRDFCLRMEDGGADLLIVHARLRREPYGRRPRWDWIGKVKGWTGLPVVGNGAIFGPEDARACLAASGCDGLMLGRGAVVRPWAFRDIAREVYGLALPEAPVDRAAAYGRYAELLREGFSPDKRLTRLKSFTQYYSRTYPFGHTLASRVQVAETFDAALAAAEAFFLASEPGFQGWEAAA